MSVNWPVLKEVAGFAGALFMAYPWLRDFAARIGLHKIKKAKAKASLAELAQELVAMDERWLAKAKALDLAATLVGLGLIALSFGIGYYLAG